MDLKTIKMASGFCLEITVFTAMATLDMEFVSTYIVPVLIYTVILAVLTVPIIFYLAYRFCREEWFEKSLHGLRRSHRQHLHRSCPGKSR